MLPFYNIRFFVFAGGSRTRPTTLSWPPNSACSETVRDNGLE